jgi:outer membrane lipoprotein carrier protein
MRAEYRKPEERLFISNGKTLYSYLPLDKEVTEEKVKDSSSDLTPMMALIGRSGLRNEFKDFTEIKTPPPLFPRDRIIRLTPNRKNEDLASIEIEVNPTNYLIDRIVVLGTDKSRNEFIFNKIEINMNIPASRFEFTPPPGTRQVIRGVTP